MTITRRQLLGATGIGLLATACEKGERGMTTSTSTTRMPVAYVPHGGGPWAFVDIGWDLKDAEPLKQYLSDVGRLPKTPPKALLVISAHWEERVPTIMTAAQPPMLYDYYGFPPASYQIRWPAPGAPAALASRVEELLASAGFESATDGERGFDHGTFIPLKLAFPDAQIPCAQLSLKLGLDPAEHLAIGRALAPLRDEGVFIIGSGMSFHNLRAFRDPRSQPVAETFDAWLRDAATAEPAERDRKLAAWESAPAARAAHPREEHLLPLMVIAGAAGTDKGTIPFNGTFAGLRLSAYHYG